jgi:NAD-dependent dihydropyrimidine dehydrogenase PreA subunit
VSTRRLLLYFPRSETEKPIVYHLVKDYDLVINIFRAKVTPEEYGYLVLDVTGSEENIARGVEFVRTLNVQVDEAQKGVRWDRERCTMCTNCIPHCPTKALHVSERATMEVAFAGELCVECLSCLENCPYGACSSIF